MEDMGVEEGGGSVGVTSNSVGPVDRADPWSGASTASMARAVEVVTNCVEAGGRCWVCRVPSDSNPAESPSTSRLSGDSLAVW
eukprot:3833979-Amphidinium_carterae.1